jgi:hypothetical protein
MFRALTIIALSIAAPAAAATTIQQDFDAAQALLDAGKAAEARTAFATLLTRFSPTSRGKAASLVRARLGNVMLATGDADAAEPMLVAALPGLTGTAESDVAERGVTAFDLGRAREITGRLDSATNSYRAALASRAFAPGSAEDIAARVALARASIWSKPAEARTLLDALLTLPPETFGKNKDQRALLETLRGRVELNDNQPAEAKRWFTIAARTAGGATTTSVSVADVRIRGDLALANFKLGKMDEVQKFVALSGAGQLLSEGLATASEMPLPGCAPLTGLAPDAVAVVEFSIADDGRTTGVTPVYASRGTGAATGDADEGPEVLFAQAVRDWSWASERLAKLDPFWRQAIRVELRCFTTRADNSVVVGSFAADNKDWIDAQGLEPLPEFTGSSAVRLPQIRAEIQRREAKYAAQSPQLLRAVSALSTNGAAPMAERSAARARFRDLAIANKAPESVILIARMQELYWQASDAKRSAEMYRRVRDGYAALLAEQEAAGRGATRIAMYIRLQLAEVLDELKATAAEQAMLDPIVSAPEALLPANDPIRIAALLRVSNLAAAARDTASAATALAATGLSPEQCALVDVRPQAINKSITEKAFPALAIGWHTGGFARVGYDITADGATTNVRTITASPPFIFGPGTEKAIAKFRYQPVLRPGNSIGCSGSEFLQRFRVLG